MITRAGTDTMPPRRAEERAEEEGDIQDQEALTEREFIWRDRHAGENSCLCLHALPQQRGPRAGSL